MIVSFKDKPTEEIYHGQKSKKSLSKLPFSLWNIAYRKFYFLEHATTLKDLTVPPSNHLELLKGDRKGQYSIRINNQYRLCFYWSKEGVKDVEICDYH